MDLLRTLLIYMAMVFVSSAQSAPEATPVPVASATPSVIEEPVATPIVTPSPTAIPTPVATPALTPNAAYKTIRVGDNGEEVREMQRKLTELGYYAGDIDGRFGNQTRRSVERFQHNNGLGVDGIAGRRTLTVLFESEDVVAAMPASTPEPTATAVPVTPSPTFVPTAAPTHTATPALTATPSPAAAPTEAVASEQPTAPEQEPVLVFETVATQEPSATPVPAATPEPEPVFSSLSESGFMLEGQSSPMAQADASALVPVEKEDGTVFVPFFSILKNAGVVVVPAITPTRGEYAFTLQNKFFHLSYNIEADGSPSGLVLATDGTPQVMENRTAHLWNDELYLPLADIEKWTAVTFTLNPGESIYTVTLPPVED